MEYKIIADSCCDMSPELRERLGVISVPLTMTLGEQEYRDDDALDLRGYMACMRVCPTRIGSAAPAPGLYADAFLKAGRAFAITLSSKLSASYASAVDGMGLALDEGAKEAHVFDSKSASAGEVLLAVKIREYLDKGLSFGEVVAKIESFIKDMKTYFVLDEYDNLIKNGRMGKLTSKVIGALGIRLIMGSDGDGQIAAFAKPRGEERMLARLVQYITESGRKPEESQLVISHCNNPGLAGKLAALVRKTCRFKEILIVQTRGISSMYANEKGIILAF